MAWSIRCGASVPVGVRMPAGVRTLAAVAMAACGEPNDACVEPEEDIATCVHSPPTECDPDRYEANCTDEGAALNCQEARGEFAASEVTYVVAQDCAGETKACEVDGGIAVCS